MNQIQLQVQKRETGKQVSKRYRSDDKVPGVFYFKEVSEKEAQNDVNVVSIPIIATPIALRDVVYTSEMQIIDLHIEGEENVRECILKEVTFDPVTDSIKHFDLLGIRRGFTMSFEVPITLKGTAIGVRDGGTLQHTLLKVNIDCLPKDLPNSIEVDISSLKIGHAIYVKDLEIENVKINAQPDAVVVSIVPPRVIKTATEEAPSKKE